MIFLGLQMLDTANRSGPNCLDKTANLDIFESTKCPLTNCTGVNYNSLYDVQVVVIVQILATAPSHRIAPPLPSSPLINPFSPPPGQGDCDVHRPSILFNNRRSKNPRAINIKMVGRWKHTEGQLQARHLPEIGFMNWVRRTYNRGYLKTVNITWHVALCPRNGV